MRDHTSDYPQPVSDPEAEGLPDVADDDSTADNPAASVREADGPRPVALPGDEPEGIDRFGTTPQEALRGPAMDDRLRQEEPDLDLEGTGEAGPAGEVGRLVGPDQGAGVDQEGSEVAYDAGTAGGGPTAEEAAMREDPEAEPGLSGPPPDWTL